MEDPNRIRTKLRLDLEDISRQISDLEDAMSKDKNADLIEDHKRLVEYEKKLKEQYEKMTGFSIEQAATLRGAKRTKETSPSGWGRFFGFIAGILFAEAFFNLTMHGIEGYGILDLISYFLDGGKAVAYPLQIVIEEGAMSSGMPMYITMGTLVAPVIFTIFESLACRARKEIYSVLEGLAFTIPSVYILFRFSVPNATSTFVNEAFIFAVLLATSGFFLFLSGFGGNFLSKLIGIINAGLYGFSAYMVYDASLVDNVSEKLKWNWPYIFVPLMVVGFISAFEFLVGINKD